MYCSNCGKSNLDENRFCVYCGAPLENRTPRKDRLAESTFMQAVREMGTSSMFLTAVVSLTVSIVAGILYAVTGTQSWINYLYPFIYQYADAETARQISEYINLYTRTAGAAGFVSAVVSNIPAILSALAVWLIYKEAKKEPGSKFETTGFTILRVFAVIGFAVLVLIAAGILLAVFGIFGAIGSSSRGNSQDAIQAAVIIILIAGIIMAFPMAYYWKLLKMLKGTAQMIMGGPIVKCASAYVGVITMMGAIGCIGTIVMAGGLGKLQGLASGVSMVCFSLLVFKFKERLEMLYISDPDNTSGMAFDGEGYDHEKARADSGRKRRAGTDSSDHSAGAFSGSGEYTPGGTDYGYGVDPEFERRISGGYGNSQVKETPEKAPAKERSVFAGGQPVYANVNPGTPGDWNGYDPHPGIFQGNPDETIVENIPQADPANAWPSQNPYAGSVPGQDIQNKGNYHNNSIVNNMFGNSVDTWVDDMQPIPQKQSGQGTIAGDLYSGENAYGQNYSGQSPSAKNNASIRDPFTDRERPIIPETRLNAAKTGAERSKTFNTVPELREEPADSVASIPAAAALESSFVRRQRSLIREEEERRAREEQERIAREEKERKAREEQERKAREEEQMRLREEQERLAREAEERRIREEQERKAREEEERLAREEEERRAREEQERKAREEEQMRLRKEQERLAREAEERRIRQEQERKAREEKERIEHEEEERKAREEQERLSIEAEEHRKADDIQKIAFEGRKNSPVTEAFYETRTLNTTPLSQPHASLTRHRDHNRVAIRIPLLRIGRNPRDVDYVIWDNPTIGRHHADIAFKNGRYYIFDNNSTNHVFLNGIMIPPGQDIPLPNEAIIRLSDEDFSFRVW